MQHKDGPHWREHLCGWDSKHTLMKAAELKCDRTLRPDLIAYATVRYRDTSGKEKDPD